VERDAFYEERLQEMETLLELLKEGEPVEEDLQKALEDLEAPLSHDEMRMLLGDEDDHRDAIVAIHPGAGGTESADWARMLHRMYTRWIEAQDFQLEVLDFQPGEEAGLKSVTFTVRGEYAYGYLKAESGVHRLVRISPFDAASRRHTSFASVYVSPDIEKEIEIDLDEKDLRVDTYRSSGAGGQHVNVTDSAVRITHLPTKIVVQCQNERSQHQNRATAMRVLRSRLYELELEKRRMEQEKRSAAKKDIAWGSQIRSYVLHPYQMVKDHRTEVEAGNAEGVLDGALDRFIEGYLVWLAGVERPESAR